MPYSVSKLEVWTGDIEDRAGGLAAKLDPLADAGANLKCVIARRQPHRPGKGVVFLGPVSGAKAKKAAATAKLKPAKDIAALRVEGPNKAGAGRQMMRVLAHAGINLRGISAVVLGNKFVAMLAFDRAADANRAANLLQSAGRKKR